MARKLNIVETACSCGQCVAMCLNNPCWGTPEEIRAAIHRGFGPMMSLHIDIGIDSDEIVRIQHVQPAKKGLEGEEDRWGYAGCALLTEDDRCPLHGPKKPVEARISTHDHDTYVINGDTRPREWILRRWNTKLGRAVVARWKKVVGYEE